MCSVGENQTENKVGTDSPPRGVPGERPPRPVALPLLHDNIPAELQSLPHWVHWRYTWKYDRRKWDKPPINVHTNGNASTTNSRTWATYEVALKMYGRAGKVRKIDGLGIVLSEDDDLFGMDLDHVRDPVTGALAAWVVPIITKLATYAEASPSGEGVRVFGRGTINGSGRKRAAAEIFSGVQQLPGQDPPVVEIYDRSRYLTVTGQILPNVPRTVGPCQEQLNELYQQLGERAQHKGAGSDGGGVNYPSHLSDDQLLAKARASQDGPAFSRLYDQGDSSGFDNDASRADWHLCRKLAFWAGGQRDRIDRLFRGSALMRAKWDEQHGKKTYGEMTIDSALEGLTEFFGSRNGRRNNGRGGKGPPAAGVGGGGSPAGSGGAIETDDDPHRLARLFLYRHINGNDLSLRFWRDGWHRWEGTAYREIDEPELRGEVVYAIKQEFDRIAAASWAAWRASKDKNKPPHPPAAMKVSTRLVADVRQALASLALLPGRTDQPAWIAPPAWLSAPPFTPPFAANEVLACKNGLVHLPSLVSGAAHASPHTTRFFSPNALDYDFDLQAPAPTRWLGFLNDLWSNDPQAVEALQEWFGYCLLPDTRQQKILFVVGPKRSGKGTIARVLRALVGIDNSASPTLAGLGTNFGLWPLLGKTVAIISDARLSSRTDAAVVAERLLAISGEDAQTIDRKHRSQVTVKLPVRFVILSNELPRISDPSGALVGRFVVLRQTRSWYGREDIKLTDDLLGELPGILLWAIAGWQRLQARGHFVQPNSGKPLIGDLEDLASPVGAFIRERCMLGPEHEVLVKDLFEAWRSWCGDKGRKEPGTEAVFGRDLRAAQPSIDTRQPRVEGGDKGFTSELGSKTRNSGSVLARDGTRSTPLHALRELRDYWYENRLCAE